MADQNSYYEALAASPYVFYTENLRSQASIDRVVRSAAFNVSSIYDPTFDAMKATINSDENGLQNAAELDFPGPGAFHQFPQPDGTNTWVMIWDERWGDPWTTVIYEDPIWGSAKTMSLPNNDAIAGQGDRWFQWHMEFKRNDPDPDVFAYRWAGTSFNYGGANMTKFQPIQPANYQDFYTKVNAWTRHWIIFQEVAPYTDPVSLVTIWTADENRAPVKVLDARQIRIPWDPATARGWKRTEMLIQPKPNRLPDGGTSVFTHYRNFIILKNYPDIPSILVSPLAGDPIGTIAGIATVTGVSASQSAAESVGTSNGVGAATGVGQSTMTVVGASAGASVAVAQPETGLFGFKARHHMLMMDTI